MGGWVKASCPDRAAQAAALCEENSGDTYWAYGPRVGAGATSTARCHEYAMLISRNAFWG
ncbi:hypothetical protein GCM10022252_72980 [Streptosporangium oxazolinicum]|uniref:Uncharacterized protein n=1 Tax=Streptosporangium oxazolinicum TaxID=909287 RepID=A0ABP8BJ32_9ACTN